ncbi:hypothetical protein RIR_jg23017.t1 [Rhizophagus irregularis DAOM 181602=DAOM 197198]|nr:hypothetical protein RIR_jg23017.t1 [Rhizophagus irregularis DAOM 181602=DAOM 197198]
MQNIEVRASKALYLLYLENQYQCISWFPREEIKHSRCVYTCNNIVLSQQQIPLSRIKYGIKGHNVVAGSRILEFPDVSFPGLLGLTSTKIYISQTRHKNKLADNQSDGHYLLKRDFSKTRTSLLLI